MSTKVCRACCNEKSLDEFTKDKSQKSGLNSKCKDCMREYNRAYYAENKQRMQDYHRDYQRDYQCWRWYVCRGSRQGIIVYYDSIGCR